MKKTSYQKMIDAHGIEWVREYYRNKQKERRQKNGDEVLAYRRKWHAANRDKLCQKKRERRKNRTDQEREAQRAYDKKRREENPEKMKAWLNNWKANNKDKIAKYNKDNYERITKCKREYARKNRHKAIARHKQRCQEDPTYHIVARLRARMGVAVRKAAVRKSGKSIELLGCTEAELVAHLESQFKDGMSWENRDKWHVDHVLPLSSFNLSDPEQQKAAFGYKNLQPLWILENLSKSDKITA